MLQQFLPAETLRGPELATICGSVAVDEDGSLDFAAFLLLMRRLIDMDFGGLHSAAATAAAQELQVGESVYVCACACVCV